MYISMYMVIHSSYIIRYFGIDKTERHRAADDAAQTAQVFERLKQI